MVYLGSEQSTVVVEGTGEQEELPGSGERQPGPGQEWSVCRASELRLGQIIVKFVEQEQRRLHTSPDPRLTHTSKFHSFRQFHQFHETLR